VLRLSTREKEIIRILSEDGSAAVSGISEVLGVSAVTVRSDLKGLAEKGLIVRTRGGAFPAFHPAILERQKVMVDEKNRIAKAAADRVEDGDNIAIVAGTTTPLMVKYLLGKRDVHVVTNSTLVFPYARINPALRMTVVGGEFRPSAEAIFGPDAVRGLERFHVQQGVPRHGRLSRLRRGSPPTSVEAAEFVKVAAEQSDQSTLLADSTKYGRAGFAQIMELQAMDGIITDSGLPKAARKELEQCGLSVETV
jgi:DeoR family galactitol utilization operon repressor